jgi:hypothetical protein
MFVITKWCKSITDDDKDHYTHKDTKGMPHKFRLLDDDGIIYAYGQCSSCDDDDAFDPLDTTGVDYGCTEIQYKNPETKKWETL